MILFNYSFPIFEPILIQNRIEARNVETYSLTLTFIKNRMKARGIQAEMGWDFGTLKFKGGDR